MAQKKRRKPARAKRRAPSYILRPKLSKRSQWYFTLERGGRIVMTSEEYASMSSMARTFDRLAKSLKAKVPK